MWSVPRTPQRAYIRFSLLSQQVQRTLEGWVFTTSQTDYVSSQSHRHAIKHNFYGVTQILLEDVDPDSFKSFLHYLYKGRLDQPILQGGPRRYERALELLRVSHKYGHMDLFTESKETLVSLMNFENACEMFEVAE